MPPEIVDAIAPLIALLGLGTFSLIGLRMFLGYKARRLELGTGDTGQGDGRIENVVEELRNEVQLLRGDVSELHERLDFTERVLTRGQESAAPPGKRDA